MESSPQPHHCHFQAWWPEPAYDDGGDDEDDDGGGGDDDGDEAAAMG